MDLHTGCGKVGVCALAGVLGLGLTELTHMTTGQFHALFPVRVGWEVPVPVLCPGSSQVQGDTGDVSGVSTCGSLVVANCPGSP